MLQMISTGDDYELDSPLRVSKLMFEIDKGRSSLQI